MQESFSIRHILFPTDFSKSSESAALQGWHAASELHFVVGDDVLRNLELNQHATEAPSLEMLEALKTRCFQDVDCEICAKTGGVADAIVEYAREMQADLIMMPTRGFGPPRPFLIGSVTAKVLHDARCPVWISPHPKELEAFHPYRKILCAMDYRVLSRDLLAQDLFAEHQPGNTTEELLVNEMAEQYWRIRRFRLLEAQIWENPDPTSV